MSPLRLALVLLLLAALAPADPARAGGREVHVYTGIANLTPHTEVGVIVEGPFLRPTAGVNVMVPIGGNIFGQWREVGPGPNKVVTRVPAGHLIEMDGPDVVHAGHTRHYNATFIDMGTRQAFATYHWKAKVNLRGVLDCELVEVLDPDARLVVLHKKTDKGFTEEELTGRLGPELVARGATPELFVNAATIEHFLHDYLGIVGEVGATNANLAGTALGTAAALNALIATSAGTCLSQIWIMPSRPLAERTEMAMFMPSFGSSEFSHVADFNGDGLPDFATAIGQTLNLSASFGPFAWRSRSVDMGINGAAPWGGGGYNFFGDFDGDGKADIAAAVGRTIYVRKAADEWRPAGFAVAGQWGSGSYTWAADFDGDGRTDIASGDGGWLHGYYSDGNGFTSQSSRLARRWGSASYVRIGDFNGDGKADIASPNGGRVHVKLSQGRSFITQDWPVRGSWGDAGYTWVGDFNGDGKADLASARGGDISVHLSTGQGFNSQVWSVPRHWGAGGHTWAADFNGDGKDDIASADGGVIFVNLSTGQGFNQRRWDVPSWWGGAGYTWVADFDRDGKADVATASDDQIRVKLSRGL